MPSCITPAQRTVHVVSELAAVTVMVPFWVWLARQSALPQWARILSGVCAAGTLVVDGYLLTRFLSDRA
jgi:hypothetical protein